MHTRQGFQISDSDHLAGAGVVQTWWCCQHAGSSRQPRPHWPTPVVSPGRTLWCPARPSCLPLQSPYLTQRKITQFIHKDWMFCPKRLYAKKTNNNKKNPNNLWMQLFKFVQQWSWHLTQNDQPCELSMSLLNDSTRPANPMILLSVLPTACVHIFRFLTELFCRCATNQSKQTNIQGQIGTLWHSDAFNFFNLLKSFWIVDHRTLSPKAVHCVCYFCWFQHQRILLRMVVWSEPVCCILPPLRRFVPPTALNSNRIWRWLTSRKVQMQSQCSLV